MTRLLRPETLTIVRRLVMGPESLLVAMAVLFVELMGTAAANDVDDSGGVFILALLSVAFFSAARYRAMPLTHFVMGLLARVFGELRDRLRLSLGLDFHPERTPRPPPFTSLRRTVLVLGLTALVVYPARGILREVLSVIRVPGLYTVHVLALGLLWALLLSGIVIQVPASVLAILEVVKRRIRLDGAGRVLAVAAFMAFVAVLLITLDSAVGLEGCLLVLAFASLLPTAMYPVDPPRGPWLNIALGRARGPSTARLGELLRDGHRLCALEALVLVSLLAPSARVDGGLYPITDLLLETFGWLSAWLFTGGALLAVTEFNRRRRLYDPAYPRSRVLWAIPGPEASALAVERAAIERSGWRLVVADRVPGSDDADLLVGLPSGLMPGSRVPLTKVPPALFLLEDDPGAVLNEAEERDKAERCTTLIERLLVSARPRLGDRGEGTFLVPHCWLVVGLTRDDDRGGLDRSPSMTFGQSFQATLGTRLRRFLYDVMHRAGIDVFYIEDAVTPQQVSEVLELLFERHIARTEPANVSEHDLMGVNGVRVVLHDVDPETAGIAGVDNHVTRNAISRARIIIVGRDRRDGDDGDDPPVEGESNDLWLRESLRQIFQDVQRV